MDGADLEALMKNPSLCPALRSPEKRLALAVGKNRDFKGLTRFKIASKCIEIVKTSERVTRSLSTYLLVR